MAIKPGHPPALRPGAFIAPPKNALLYDGTDFFVFEEKLQPGDTRARLQQWPDGEAQKI